MTSILKVDSIQNSAGTAAMTIASDGKVTLPQHLLLTQYPHFEANLSSDMTGFNSDGAHGAGVAFNNTLYNIGNHFKTSGTDIGLFVVPFDGIYYLDAATISPNTMAQSWFTLNNARMPRSDFVMGTSVNRVSNKMIKQFSAGDKIGFHPYRSGATNLTISSNTNHTWFRGGLLQAL